MGGVMIIPMKWLPIPGYEGLYEVSDEGQIRSLINNHGQSRKLILSPGHTPKGRPMVVLTKNKSRTSRQVSSLVMAAFIGPRPDGTETRHLDGNPDNNHLSNLIYGSRRQNQLDSVGHGTHNMASKTECKWGHKFDEENTRIIFRRGGYERVCRACARRRGGGGQ